MIKVLKSKGIVLSGFLLCSFYYIVSYKETSPNNENLWTGFDGMSENAIFTAENPRDLPIATTEIMNSHQEDIGIVDGNEQQRFKITPENVVYENLENWSATLKITAIANKLAEMFSQSITLTKSQLEDMAHEAIIKQKDSIQKQIDLYSNDKDWSELLVQNNGKPIRNVIFTTWRSGSTFAAEVITSHPAMFYHYEPLLHFDIVQVRSGELANEGLRVIKDLLNCNYSNLEDYVNYGVDHTWLHSHNTRLWSHCIKAKKLCLDPKFLGDMCQLFPFQIMKTVRMRLKLAEELLKDESLNIRILLLVRDPRGTIQSRKHRDWCPPSPDCSDEKLLCSDMVDDYFSAIKIRDKYPDRIMLIRYEDLSLRPYAGFKKVFEFFRLGFYPVVKNFIKKHTGVTRGGVSSTFRDSKTTPFQWMNYFQDKQEELSKIQYECSDAMKLWGYDMLNGSKLINSQNTVPLLNPPWQDMVILNDTDDNI